MKYYNIESVGGIEFAETGDELLNVDGGDDTRLARYDSDKSIQSSGVSLDDSDNMAGINNLSIAGDLYIDGTTFIVHSGEVSTSDTIIYINYGEVGAGVTGGQAGIQVDRGSLTDYQFLFVESDDSFKVGEMGSLQAVATREDAPTNNYVPYWNDTLKRFDTAGSIPISSISIPTGTNMWFYEDSAPSGWTIVAAIGDELLAVKGGSTYTTGGAQAGSWSLSVTTDGKSLSIDEVPNHNHKWYEFSGSGKTYAADGTTMISIGANHQEDGGLVADATGDESFNLDGYTARHRDLAGSADAHDHYISDSSFRPDARVGIIASKD